MPKGGDMPKVSKESVPPIEQGGAGVEWRGELDGYVASIVTVNEDTDLTPLLQGLPGDQCPSPHWGYVLKGEMWWRYGDREERIGEGEAYYALPGHTAGASAGSEFVVFSPSEVIARVEEHMTKRTQELFGAPAK
jgi:hypothetical protein